MRIWRVLLAAGLALAFLLVVSPTFARPQAQGQMLMATLSGAAEVPGPGDTDGAGMAMVTIDPSKNEVCYDLTVSNITLPAAAAHIHKGASTVAGPVVVGFTPAPDAAGKAAACVTGDAAVVADIAANPAGYYVNVHTSDYPAGAVRGQLGGQAAQPAATATPQPAQPAAGPMLTAALSGAAEVPGPGDTDGTGTAMVTINTSANQVCYDLTVSNITLPAAAAHIHKGDATVAGPVVVGFTPAPDAAGKAAACVTGDAAVVADIAANPAGYYVNVHTSDFPAGAVRGQLGGQGAPPAAATATPVAAGGTPSQLPTTGSSEETPIGLIMGALALLVAGAVVVMVTRRSGRTR